MNAPNNAFILAPARAIILTSYWTNRLCRWLLVALGSAMFAVVLLQVVCRYLFNNSLFWSEEAARMLLVQITFLGAAVAYYGKFHIMVDIAVARAGKSLRRVMNTAGLLVCGALFLAMLVYGRDFSQVLALQRAASLPVNLAVPFVIIPASGAIMLLHTLAMFLQEWLDLKPGGAEAGA